MSEETEAERRSRYRRNRESVRYNAWLYPETGQSLHITDRDADVVDLALGSRTSLASRALYTIAKRQSKPTVYDRGWLAAKIGAQDIDAVTRHLKLLKSEGLIDYKAIRRATKEYRKPGMWIAWVPDNLAEQMADEDAGDRVALQERDRKVDSILEIVSQMRTAAPEELPALMAALHAATGGDGASEPPGGGGPKAPEPTGGPTGSAGKEDGSAPHGHEEPEPETADDVALDEETAELPGYAKLAAADRRADKGKPRYQKEAREAYQALLEDRMRPTPEEVVGAYKMYQKGLVEQGLTKMMRPLGRWLGRDDEYGARAGVRALRKERAKDGSSSGDDQGAPRADCPYCGHEMAHFAGYVYICDNPGCERRGRVNVLGREEECHVRPR